jgi:putative transposase
MVWPVATQCRVLDVSASGYHQYQARQREGACHLQPGRRIGDIALLVHITAIFNEV